MDNFSAAYDRFESEREAAEDRQDRACRHHDHCVACGGCGLLADDGSCEHCYDGVTVYPVAVSK